MKTDTITQNGVSVHITKVLSKKGCALKKNELTKEQIKNIRKEFFSQEGTILQKSLSIGFGAFMGVVPIWGFQMLAALFLSYIFKLNKVIVLLFSNISIPPLLPFILFGSFYAGHLVIGGEGVTLEWVYHVRSKLSPNSKIVSSYGASDIDIGVGFL